MTCREELAMWLKLARERPHLNDDEIRERIDACKAGEKAAQRAFRVFKRALDKPHAGSKEC